MASSILFSLEVKQNKFLERNFSLPALPAETGLQWPD
jgi:hypothetical protein